LLLLFYLQAITNNNLQTVLQLIGSKLLLYNLLNMTNFNAFGQKKIFIFSNAQNYYNFVCLEKSSAY